MIYFQQQNPPRLVLLRQERTTRRAIFFIFFSLVNLFRKKCPERPNLEIEKFKQKLWEEKNSSEIILSGKNFLQEKKKKKLYLTELLFVIEKNQRGTREHLFFCAIIMRLRAAVMRL